MNWLHGTPSTLKPFGAYCSCSASSCSYWGVSPHFDATLTMRVTDPSSADSASGEPSSEAMGVS